MAQKNSKSSRGFFFTVMSLAILSFMLLTVQIWVRSFEQSDQRQAQRFKGEAMRLVLTTLSDDSLSNFANASAFYATYRLANYSATPLHGLSNQTANDTRNPGTGAVESSIISLMLNGTTNLNPALNYSPGEYEAYTAASWQQKIRSAANLMGFNASFSDPYNFRVSQLDAWTVGASFDMDMNISDLEGTMYQSKQLHARTNFSINGFPDPSIQRNDMKRRSLLDPSIAATRQIFNHATFRQPSQVAPAKVKNGTRGFGWFYGAVRENYPSTPEEFNEPLSQFILVKNYDANMSAFAPLYGAVIVTNSPVPAVSNYTNSDGCKYQNVTETACLNCVSRYSLISGPPGCPAKGPEVTNTTSNPYMSTAGATWLQGISPVNRKGVAPHEDETYLLMDNKWENSADAMDDSENHYIWDMNNMRDMSICGYYLESDWAPSFFQRMLESTGVDSSSGMVHSPLGIETFVVGKWAGGADDNFNDDQKLTKLDWRFYSADGPKPDTATPKIKGMMGCKSRDMCSGTNATSVGVGFFKLRLDDLNRYGLNQTSCYFPGRSPPMARCEP